ncbi:MAG: hypothetical protein V2A73_07080, partial [Pseudomonadota bacterium]
GRLNDLWNAVEALKHSIGRAGITRQPGALPPLKETAERAAITAESSARVVVVVGPSGVGKTTTIAKLASRDALVSGLRVALITTDVCRIGGVDQIRAYAALIGVPLEVVASPAELIAAIPRYQAADRIYVDTGGHSRAHFGALHALEGALRQIPGAEVHLAISATGTAQQIDHEVARYRFLNPTRLILTKCDEADDLEELVYAPARAAIPVAWVTTGQRVPEDIEPASADRLLELAESGRLALAEAA